MDHLLGRVTNGSLGNVTNGELVTVTNERPPMPPQEFSRHCDLLRWTPASVAIWCGYARQMGHCWATGKAPLPPQVAAWLQNRVEGWIEDPPARTEPNSRGASV